MLEESGGTQGAAGYLPWYALHVRSQYERKVRDGIARLSIESYLPIYHQRARWSDRAKTVERLLFPGYVFGAFPIGERRRILGVAGVVRILGYGTEASPVPQVEIDQVRQVIGSGQSLITMPLLATGTRVRVDSGALAGLEGIVLRVRSEMRVVVSVPLLGRSVAAELDTGNLIPVVRPARAA